MLKNYFTVAFRNLWRNKIYSIINIVGLSVGLTACFLIYLYVRSEHHNEKAPSSHYMHRLEKDNFSTVCIFTIIALFILLITCLNFIHLATAKSMDRAKEVSVRKVIGAARVQLLSQFIVEAVIICLIAFAIAVLLSSLLLPLVNQLAGKEISVNILTHPSRVLRLMLLSIGIGIVAGFYPSLVLSAYNPVNVLRGRFCSRKKGLVLRKVLVMLQCTISIVMIIGTVIVHTQLNLMQHLGPSLHHQYFKVQKLGNLFLGFAVLAILIACIGLFGLASYSTTHRTGEIRVRKMLGASVPSIIGLLSRDFIKLLLVAFFIAAPLGGYTMYHWLQEFEYRTRLAWWVFVFAGTASLIITSLTVCAQALKVARSNPINCLRME